MSRDAACQQFSDNLPELALGILTGRDRAATLAHVASCAHCTDELEQLSRAADAVVLVAPEAEPPVGFEVQLFSRMGVDQLAARRRVGRSRWLLAGVAAAAALVVGLTIGLSMGHPAPRVAQPLRPSTSTPVATASLVEAGIPVGRVSVYGGSTPVLTMDLADSAASGQVTCEVVTTDGVTHKVGTFTVSHGYGAWVAPLRVSPNDVRKAEVVSPSGTVIATAPLD